MDSCSQNEAGRLVVAPADKREEIVRLVDKKGVTAVARDLGIGWKSTQRLYDGRPVTLATLTVALMRLSTGLWP